MGRSRSYRKRVHVEMGSVERKGLLGMLTRELRADFGLSRLEAEVLAIRCRRWLGGMTGGQIPGQVALTAPAGACMRLVRQQRTEVVVTAVDVGADGAIWRESGVEGVQRARAVRVLYEIWRQGGWASLAELAALLSLTPNALAARLGPVRSAGVWLPHLRSESPQDGQLPVTAWLVARLLGGGSSESLRSLIGLSVSGVEETIRETVTIWAAHQDKQSDGTIAAALGRRPEEIAAVRQVVRRRVRSRTWRDWLAMREASADRRAAASTASCAGDILATLQQDHNMSRVAARLLHDRLHEHAQRLGPRTPKPEPGKTLYFAISDEETARARLDEAKLVPVRISYFTEQDLDDGPRNVRRTCVSALKFKRILRYTTEARAQRALLTLPDLSMLLGIHVDVVRRLIAAHRNVVVPTRGLLQDIGRGQTHRRQIVELFLQMHTETEIVDRTGHSYQSVEAYLTEFARVVTLADQGLNEVMIRRVTGRSMALVRTYLSLYRKYDQPEHAFRLAHVRRVFARQDSPHGSVGSKKTSSPTARSHR